MGESCLLCTHGSEEQRGMSDAIFVTWIVCMALAEAAWILIGAAR